jgi:hypothetical protein
MKNIFSTKIYLYLTLLLFSLCTKTANKCDTSYLSQVFLQKLRTIEKNVKKGEPYSGNTYRAIFFFEKITGVSSHAQWGDVSVYQNRKDFKTDKEAWLNWLDKNKCSKNEEEVKAIEEKVRQETPWIQN